MDGIQTPDVESKTDFMWSATAPAQQGPFDIRWICHTIPPSSTVRDLGIVLDSKLWIVWTSVSQLMLPSITPDKELCSSPVDGRQPQEDSGQQFCHLQR